MGKTKEHFKKNWKKYVGAAATAAALGGAAYGAKKYNDNKVAEKKEKDPDWKDVADTAANAPGLKPIVDKTKERVEEIKPIAKEVHKGIKKTANYLLSGKAGSDLYDKVHGLDEKTLKRKEQEAKDLNMKAEYNVDAKRALKGDSYGPWYNQKKY